jgi:hypothetical protein
VAKTHTFDAILRIIIFAEKFKSIEERNDSTQ